VLVNEPAVDGDLTVVMYHYVRPLQQTRYPQIKGRTVAEFRSQLEHLRRNYRVVGVEEVTDAWRTGEPMDGGTALLTFDDGLIDHYTHVAPILADLGLPGAFYPPAQPLLERRLLDVHRLHFVLASCGDAAALADGVDAWLAEHAPDVDVPSCRAEHAHGNRFDPAEVIYVKRMMQKVLDRPVREQLAGELFRRWVSVDEATFAEELYVSVEQLRLMRSAGFHVGSHGGRHEWFSALSAEEQRQDLEASLTALTAVGVDTTNGWSLAYPYGDHDASTRDTARALGCTLAMTTEVRPARPGVDDALTLPRLDTNDVWFRRD